jgi:hypothetical protein
MYIYQQHWQTWVARGQFFKQIFAPMEKLAPTSKVGAYALHCVGANFSIGTNLRIWVFKKNWPDEFKKKLHNTNICSPTKFLK